MSKRLVVRGLAVAAGLAIAAALGAAAPATAATGAAAVIKPASLPGAFYAEAINRNSGKCINVAGGSGSNGAWIQQYRCDNTPAAKFLFLQNTDGYYEVQNQSSRKCVDIEYGGSWLGARTQQFNCNGSQTQQFRLTELGNGYVKFVNRFSGRCIDVPNYSHDDRVVLQLWNCVAGAENQEFRLNIG
ncbi:RICIN domain-containing protein [Lentzea tibetensis]|uniref:RICIN domain-containing protein n=1 Tax=Lentzea tibetensis TaxID=2591470 RepID=A0A563EJJ5_9PSEU|nr:RICIN domain-containing protein [Lentzea tibetensis]TWP47020.1 RICIN domain-containing protein [Lentzea tibetensis]